MRKDLLVLGIFILIIAGELYPSGNKHESKLIRRLYLDAIGTIPTPEEIDWYCIYNKDAYQSALDYIISFKPSKFTPRYRNKSKYELLEIFTRKDYFYPEVKRFNSSKNIEDMIRYASGIPDRNIEDCKNKFVRDSLVVSEDYIDAADYICMWLMSRNTNLEEANRLNAIAKKMKGEKSEKIMRALLDEIVKFEDVVTR
jgi:hypothetical protein